MASTFSTSSSSVDRKALKRPDSFIANISGFFGELSSHAKGLFLGLLGILSIGLLIGFFMNRMEAQSNAARNALFLAEKALNTDIKALSGLEPGKGSTSKAPSAGSPGKSAPASADDSIEFKKLDVDTQLPDGIKRLKEIDQKFDRTRAALEARLKLGNLYFNHGEFSKAVPWYEKVAQSASGFDKAIAFSSMGYAYENLGKPADAIQSFQKALNLGEPSLKGDLLMGIARGYEATHDSAKARSTYDKILTDLPNTEYSKLAEISKSRLQ